MTEGQRHGLEPAGLLNLEEINSYRIIYSKFWPVEDAGRIRLIRLVGAGRFERPTPCAQGRCATRLRYAPTLYFLDSRLLSLGPQGRSTGTVLELCPNIRFQS
jgi:hypothetical protein